jgi:hypothetical protein
MGSVVIIIAIVVVVIGVPALVSRRPWKRENQSLSSHGATMAVLAALAERSKEGVPAPEPLPPDVDLRLGAPTAPSTVRTVPADQTPAADQRSAASGPPAPVIEPGRVGDDTGILWIGPVSEPAPPEGVSKRFAVPIAPPPPAGCVAPPIAPPPPAGRVAPPIAPPPLPSFAPERRRPDLWRADARRTRPAGGLGRLPLRGGGRSRTRTGAGAAVAVLALAVAGAATALALTDGVTQHHKGQGTDQPGGSTNPTSPPATNGSPTALTPVSSNSGSATYSVPSSSFALEVSATGPCWVEAKPSAASAQVVYEGVLDAGATHTFSASGSIWLRVGYPGHIQVSLNGVPVQVPAAGASSPFNLTFAPTSAGVPA